MNIIAQNGVRVKITHNEKEFHFLAPTGFTQAEAFEVCQNLTKIFLEGMKKEQAQIEAQKPVKEEECESPVTDVAEEAAVAEEADVVAVA